jgi:hypothetical protein
MRETADRATLPLGDTERSYIKVPLYMNGQCRSINARQVLIQLGLIYTANKAPLDALLVQTPKEVHDWARMAPYDYPNVTEVRVTPEATVDQCRWRPAHFGVLHFKQCAGA